MASKLYKKNENGEIITEQVKAEYVYACLQDGWVCSRKELEPKKKKAEVKKPVIESPTIETSYDD